MAFLRVRSKSDIKDLLTTRDADTACALFSKADSVRRKYVGDEVYLRGVIEFSNYCVRDCLYCGLRRSNRSLKRYRMGCGEIYRTAQKAATIGIKTIVLQSGEGLGHSLEEFCSLIAKIKKLRVAVTLSVGEMKFEEYARMRDAGADRYLLRFETSNEKLYGFLRPGCRLEDRLACLGWLRQLGYQVGSGAMVGLPGQDAEDIAGDILLYKELSLDMIGIGPFIAHPHTPLAAKKSGALGLTLRAIALTRIVTKDAHIPATTAVGTVDVGGRQKALECGANILMPNMTPVKYRKFYEIYPDKICISEDALSCHGCVKQMINGLGRKVGGGCGDSFKMPVKKIILNRKK